jgi:hypothetical protein
MSEELHPAVRAYLSKIGRQGILKQKGTPARRRAASIGGRAMKGTEQARIRAQKAGRANAAKNRAKKSLSSD